MLSDVFILFLCLVLGYVSARLAIVIVEAISEMNKE